MNATVLPERERLETLAGAIEVWQQQLDEDSQAAQSVDGAFVDRFKETNRRLVELNNDLHPEDFSPEALAEIRGLIINMMDAVENIDTKQPLDSLDRVLVLFEAMRHSIRDAIDWHVEGAGTDSKATVAMLYAYLEDVPKKQIAELVGVGPRQVQRWARDGGVPTRRLDLVARLVRLLSMAWTDEGVIGWFSRPRRELGGRAPADVLDDPAFERDLLLAARQGRAQHGS